MTDKWTGGKVVLSDEDIKLIRKYLRGKYTEKSLNDCPVGAHCDLPVSHYEFFMSSHKLLVPL